MMTKLYNHGLIIARLQPLHNGHVRLIKKMLEECNNVTVVLGSTQEERTQKNPFTHFERRRMLGNVFPGKLHVISIEDINNPPIWPYYVLGKVTAQFSNILPPDVYYAGSLEDSELFRNIGMKTEIFMRSELSGTALRDMMEKGSDNWKQHVPEINHPMIENVLRGTRNGRMV